MDDAARMRVGHGLTDLLKDGEPARQVRGRQEFGQGASLDELHAEEGSSIRQLAQLMDRSDARMLELAHDLRLFEEALAQAGVFRTRPQQNLDGQTAVKIGSVG